MKLPDATQDLATETIAHMILLVNQLDQLMSRDKVAEFLIEMTGRARDEADDCCNDVVATDNQYLDWVAATRGDKKPPAPSIRR